MSRKKGFFPKFPDRTIEAMSVSTMFFLSVGIKECMIGKGSPIEVWLFVLFWMAVIGASFGLFVALSISLGKHLVKVIKGVRT